MDCQCRVFTEKEVVHSNGTKHIRRECRDCGKFYGFKRHVPNSEFKMPFGKFIGKDLSQVLETDPHYFEWLMKPTDSNNLKKRMEDMWDSITGN